MNYPIWELWTIGGGTLIALIAVLHVYIAHLAVGGGLFLWLTDWKGFRDKNPRIHDYVRKHIWFFLLLTMVFGGMTGVGIWFIIGLVSPDATSALIHSFVFGWAIEWVFFLGEIIALLIYAYKFDQLGRSARLQVAFFYFLFAWLSLFIINGILTFMLTPGQWLITGAFWDGFFNPTFFTSLFFRSFMAFMLAGLFGYVTAVFIKDKEFKQTMMRYCSKWLLYPFIGLVLSAVAYYFSIPSSIRERAFVINPQTPFFVTVFIISSILIFAIGLYFSLKTRAKVQKGLVFVLVIIGLAWMGGFEFTREIARKPYVLNDIMYSNAIKKAHVENLDESGFLSQAKWSQIKSIDDENKLAAGKELFRMQCLSCHTVNGIRNDIVKRTTTYTEFGMVSQLTGLGKIQTYMPPFVGTDREKEALAHYIMAGLHPPGDSEEAEPIVAEPAVASPDSFGPENDYILLAWNDLGMHCISDCDEYFVILPPANTLQAQLFKRGAVPEFVTEGVELTYQVEEGFKNPSAHVPFWDYVDKTFGMSLEKNIGLSGNDLQGTFEFDDETMSYNATAIPVVPYRDGGGFIPYPIFRIQAKDRSSGEILAITQVVAPNSTEMGCRHCHAGEWRVDNQTGVSELTAANILQVHDRISGTSLLKEARQGNPRLCQECHADPAVNQQGNPELLNFSAAMHGWHANYMPMNDELACQMCHPADPGGGTRCFRGIHAQIGVTCVECHGTLQEHASSLLNAEHEKPGASRLLAHLSSERVAIQEIKPRNPWQNQPDCLNCHTGFQMPEGNYTGFNQWVEDPADLYRNRTGYAGVRCIACHGSTHAIYPAINPMDMQRDNLQPLQYTGAIYPVGASQTCEACHKQAMEFPVHHENMDREPRIQF
jgi:hypothetical protein